MCGMMYVRWFLRTKGVVVMSSKKEDASPRYVVTRDEGGARRCVYVVPVWVAQAEQVATLRAAQVAETFDDVRVELFTPLSA